MIPIDRTKPVILKTNPAAGLIFDELEYRKITHAEAATVMKIPRARLCDIFAGRRGVSADTALRIQRWIGIDAGLLVALQARYDLSKAHQQSWERVISEIAPLHAA